MPLGLSLFLSFPLFTMILAYRYIRDKRRQSKAAREARDNGSVPAHQPSQTQSNQTQSKDDAQTLNAQSSSTPAPESSPKPGGISTSAKHKILLMAALALPVFFETLDYTGPSPSSRSSPYT